MSETKFTPGPWVAWGIQVGPLFDTDDQCNGMQRAVCYLEKYDWPENEKANANLIKSAPDLYYALQELLIQTRQYGHKPEIKDAEHALAKARGESHE